MSDEGSHYGGGSLESDDVLEASCAFLEHTSDFSSLMLILGANCGFF